MLSILQHLKHTLKHRVVLQPMYKFSRWQLSQSRGEENEETLRSLKDCHKGKRCFIIGNGPSLKAEDLDKITENGDMSFAANKISLIFPKTIWRPTYYAVFDESMQKTIQNLMNEVPAKCKFFRSDSYFWNKGVSGECLFMNASGNQALLENPKFSSDLSQIVYTIGTVTYVLIQLAAYMGFTEIYVLGVDNNYAVNRQKDGTLVENKENNKSYFEGITDEKVQKSAASPWEMEVAYHAAKKYADANGIKIYNATRGGKLEVYPRVDFDSLF